MIEWFEGRRPEAPITVLLHPYDEHLAGYWREFTARTPGATLPPGAEADNLMMGLLGATSKRTRQRPAR